MVEEEEEVAPSEDNNLFSISIEPEEKDEFTKILYRREISILPEDGEDEGSFGYKDGADNQKDNRKRKYPQKSRFGGGFKRYHIEIEDSNVRPGVISMKLREALGLNQYQLPRFIYNMRSIGYPPGWLEECRQGNNSGINMFDSNGERVPNQNEEEGEIVVEKTDYDLSKIIEYPGYNVWPNADTLNETEKYNALPMYREHSKEFFIECLKKKMEVLNNSPDSSTRDMETEETEDVLIDTKCTNLVFVPSLPECEEEQPPPPGEDKNDEIKDNCENAEQEDASTPKFTSKKKKKKKKKEKSKMLEDNDVNFPDDSLNETHGKVKSVEFGTPAFKLHSPYTKLPPPEAFSKDISDVEYFVNLPNATGKYEQLKVVLSSVRAKLNQLKESKN
ncbi:zinc finger CCHC domain-containing protein 8 homolog [Cimex lectularius]|uniref:PSP proline-rich domain-containing protein n=1 Tax=Cimex lectularius TaxID=79782 RepID=A0A8I6RN38_CIMLE|nr:zinc finger CCHC domain-containing protein 8 homolog [Cimex lectularius]